MLRFRRNDLEVVHEESTPSSERSQQQQQQQLQQPLPTRLDDSEQSSPRYSQYFLATQLLPSERHDSELNDWVLQQHQPLPDDAGEPSIDAIGRQQQTSDLARMASTTSVTITTHTNAASRILSPDELEVVRVASQAEALEQQHEAALYYSNLYHDAQLVDNDQHDENHHTGLVDDSDDVISELTSNDVPPNQPSRRGMAQQVDHIPVEVIRGRNISADEGGREHGQTTYDVESARTDETQVVRPQQELIDRVAELNQALDELIQRSSREQQAAAEPAAEQTPTSRRPRIKLLIILLQGQPMDAIPIEFVALTLAIFVLLLVFAIVVGMLVARQMR